MKQDDPHYLQTIARQAEGADPFQSVWVSANAGSGKTKVLIDRVARILLEGVAPDSLLCITYTTAAANEMQERLFKRLGAWSVMPADELEKSLNGLQNTDGKVRSEAELKRARALFARALETPGGLRIETIHAFCGRVLRRFPLEADVPIGFQELDETAIEQVWGEAVGRTLTRWLDDPDWRAAFDRLVDLGAGLGVDSVLSQIRYHASELRDYYTDARDLPTAIAQVEDALGAPAESVSSIVECTVGADLPRADLVAACAILAGGTKGTDQPTADRLSFVLSDAPAQERFDSYLRVAQTKAGEPAKSNAFTKAGKGTIVADLFEVKDMPEGSEISRLREAVNAIKARQAADISAAILTVAAPLLDGLAEAKRRQSGLDFDDLLIKTRDLLSRPGLSDWVLYKIDGGLTHLLLDEAQDTSPVQWQVLNSLLAEFFAGLGRHEQVRTQFVVGDEKQSIYSFQGADPRAFVQQRQDFIADQTAASLRHSTPDMTMSFRSTPDVLRYVDNVFSSGDFDPVGTSSVTPPAADLVTHIPYRDEHAGQVEVWPLEPPEPVEEATAWDAPLDMESSTSPKAKLAARIADWVHGVLSRGDRVWAEAGGGEWVARRPRAEDILILVRGRTGGLFDAIIRALREKRLPVAGADRLRLLDSLAVQDLLNLIRFVLLPSDDLTMAEVLKSPFCGLVDDDADLLPLAYDRKPGESLWQRLQASVDPRYDMAKAFLSSLLECSNQPAFEFLSFALNYTFSDSRTGLERLLARLGAPSLDPIEALIDRAARFDGLGAASLQLFLQAIEGENAEIKRQLSAPDGEIRVMTVHASKGLEAPIVILPDTTSDPFKRSASGLQFTADGLPVWLGNKSHDTTPIAAVRQDLQDRALEEHGRLLYVALTRACDRLLICGAWTGRATGEGYAANSWYATCKRAALRLTEGETLEDEEDTQKPIVIGASIPSIEAAPGARTGREASLPDWFVTPVSGVEGTSRVLSPTSLMPGEAPIIPPFGANPPDRMRRGRLIHGLLEILPEISPDQRDTRAALYLDQAQETDPDSRADILNAVWSILQDPVFAELFTPDGRSEVAVVGAAPELPKGVLINGRVDRLVVTNDKVLIVDYKTDRPAPATVDGIGEPYIAQMAAYRAVLRGTYPGRTVECAFVWTDGPNLMTVPEHVMDELLVSLVKRLN